MCDYCSCRSMPVIEELGADHEDLLARAGRVRTLIADGDRSLARAEFDDLLARLRVHTEVEEASVFAGLRTAGELLDDVDALSADHAHVWSVASELGVDDARDAAVIQLLDDLHEHITREEYDLFPATLVAIGPTEWDHIEMAGHEARAHAH